MFSTGILSVNARWLQHQKLLAYWRFEQVQHLNGATVPATGQRLSAGDRSTAEPQPLAYLPLTQDYSPAVTMQVRTTGLPRPFVATVRSRVQSLDANLPLTNMNTIGELLDQGLWAPRMGASLLTVFGGLALILAIVGVYGVLSYSVNQQTREIGIRMAMGAQTSSVLALVVKQGMRLAAMGLMLGLLVALAAMRVLSSLLFGVSAHDPLIFGSVSLILATAAILACYFPARRAARVDPLVALRYE